MPLSPLSCLRAGPRVLVCARDSRRVLGCACLLAAEVTLDTHLTLRVREDSLSPHTETGVANGTQLTIKKHPVLMLQKPRGVEVESADLSQTA